MFCNDLVPAYPVPRILSLFQRLQRLIAEDGPKAGISDMPQGVGITHAEICSAITEESRRGALLKIGETRRWPEIIDWSDVQYRLSQMDEELIDLCTNPNSLARCSTWKNFLLALDFKIFSFCKSKKKVDVRASCCREKLRVVSLDHFNLLFDRR